VRHRRGKARLATLSQCCAHGPGLLLREGTEPGAVHCLTVHALERNDDALSSSEDIARALRVGLELRTRGRHIGECTDLNCPTLKVELRCLCSLGDLRSRRSGRRRGVQIGRPYRIRVCDHRDSGARRDRCCGGRRIDRTGHIGVRCHRASRNWIHQRNRLLRKRIRFRPRSRADRWGGLSW